MYKARRRTILTFVYIFIAITFILLASYLIPQTKINDFRDYTNTFPVTVTSVLFGMLLLIASAVYGSLRINLEKRVMRHGATAFLTDEAK